MSVAASRHSATTTSWGSYSRSDGSCVSKCRTPKDDNQRRNPAPEMVDSPFHSVTPSSRYTADATSEQNSRDGSV